MEKLLIPKKQEVLSLITDITYANVPSWYGATRRDLRMDLIVPKNREEHRPCPCIIWICGGAFMVNDKSVWMPEMVRFARAGYAVASIEYRTSNEVSFPEPLKDVKAAIRYLRAHAAAYCLDPERFVVMGESAGGTMASLAGVTSHLTEYDEGDFLEHSSAVQGVVDFYGLTDMELSSEEPASGTDVVPDWAMKAFLGVSSYEENKERASAVRYVTQNTPPCLILHGTVDALVPVQQSITFYHKLKEAGVYTELYLLEGANHGDDLFFQDEMIERIERFLRQIL